MKLNDLQNAGNEILREVNRAVRENDYTVLGDTIREQVSDIASEVQSDVAEMLSQQKAENPGRVYKPEYKSGYSSKPSQHVKFSSKISPFLQRKVSRLSGVGKIVAGAFGTLFCGTMAISMFTIGAAVGAFSAGVITGTAIAGALTAGSIGMIVNGSKKRGQIQRYYEYGRIIDQEEYYPVKKLAIETGKTEDYVRRDLEKMSRDNLIPQLWFDENKTTLMLTQEVYEQYREAERSRAEREAQQKTDVARDEQYDENVRKILREGEVYRQTIHDCNIEIIDTDMSSRLDVLEKTLVGILEQLRKQPSNAGKLRRLMNYYLPTTVKLLYAYIELNRQEDPGENIVKTQREIEDAMDTINEALDNLYDSMFDNMAWDISSDISVMKTMMEQDGLKEADGPGKM